METSKNLRLNSSGSDINIDKVTSLEIYSTKDDIEIEAIGSIYGNLKFTNLVLNRLDKDIDLSMKSPILGCPKFWTRKRILL